MKLKFLIRSYHPNRSAQPSASKEYPYIIKRSPFNKAEENGITLGIVSHEKFLKDYGDNDADYWVYTYKKL